jgi:adenine-specific DNA-methyltransferase
MLTSKSRAGGKKGNSAKPAEPYRHPEAESPMRPDVGTQARTSCQSSVLSCRFGDPQHSITDQVLRAYEHRDKWVNRTVFPRTGAWESLKKALKGEYEETVWDHLAGTVSAAFEAGQQGQVAVKVIDDRGNELLVVEKVGGQG